VYISKTAAKAAVIPANAGIQVVYLIDFFTAASPTNWIPAFAGMMVLLIAGISSHPPQPDWLYFRSVARHDVNCCAAAPLRPTFVASLKSCSTTHLGHFHEKR
jgi:hypothetical protein